MKHHTKDKGDKGVGFVIADLLSKDIQVCLPISEHLPFDLVGVYPDGMLKRISVKYRATVKGGLEIRFRSTYSDSKRVYVKPIDKNLIDIVAIYCPDNGKVYYIKPMEFKKTVKLRVDPLKKNQKRNIKNGDDYLVP